MICDKNGFYFVKIKLYAWFATKISFFVAENIFYDLRQKWVLFRKKKSYAWFASKMGYFCIKKYFSWSATKMGFICWIGRIHLFSKYWTNPHVLKFFFLVKKFFSKKRWILATASKHFVWTNLHFLKFLFSKLWENRGGKIFFFGFSERVPRWPPDFFCEGNPYSHTSTKYLTKRDQKLLKKILRFWSGHIHLFVDMQAHSKPESWKNEILPFK